MLACHRSVAAYFTASSVSRSLDCSLSLSLFSLSDLSLSDRSLCVPLHVFLRPPASYEASIAAHMPDHLPEPLWAKDADKILEDCLANVRVRLTTNIWLEDGRGRNDAARGDGLAATTHCRSIDAEKDCGEGWWRSVGWRMASACSVLLGVAFIYCRLVARMGHHSAVCPCAHVSVRGHLCIYAFVRDRRCTTVDVALNALSFFSIPAYTHTHTHTLTYYLLAISRCTIRPTQSTEPADRSGQDGSLGAADTGQAPRGEVVIHRAPLASPSLSYPSFFPLQHQV